MYINCQRLKIENKYSPQRVNKVFCNTDNSPNSNDLYSQRQKNVRIRNNEKADQLPNNKQREINVTYTVPEMALSVKLFMCNNSSAF